MNSPWYEVVESGTPLTQGDLIFDCPLLTWNATATLRATGPQESEALNKLRLRFELTWW